MGSQQPAFEGATQRGDTFMSGLGRNNRPILSRGETIESCCSEDLVTVLEVSQKIERERKRPFKVMDRLRIMRKGIMASSLQELLTLAREKLLPDPRLDVYLVLDSDGTEIDDEEYFETLEENTTFILLLKEDIWSPYGPPFTLGDLASEEIQV